MWTACKLGEQLVRVLVMGSVAELMMVVVEGYQARGALEMVVTGRAVATVHLEDVVAQKSFVLDLRQKLMNSLTYKSVSDLISQKPKSSSENSRVMKLLVLIAIERAYLF